VLTNLIGYLKKSCFINNKSFFKKWLH